MNAKDVKTILYNPFWGSKLIPHFLSGCAREMIKTELVYLLFPFVFYQDSKKILVRARVNSTLYSAFLGNSDGRTALAGLEKRYAYFKPLTSQSIIVAVNTNFIQFGDFLRLRTSVDYTKEKDPLRKEYYKASKYLGQILSRAPYLDTFMKLGIKEL